MKKKKRIWSQFYKRVYFNQCEFKLMLLKSVKLNRNINNYYRAYAYAYIIRNKRKFKYLNYTQTCILSGRSKSV